MEEKENIKQWLSHQPSDLHRSLSTAISDKTFIQMYLDLYRKHRGHPKWNRDETCDGLNNKNGENKLKLEKLNTSQQSSEFNVFNTFLYEENLTVLCDSYVVRKSESKSAESVDTQHIASSYSEDLESAVSSSSQAMKDKNISCLSSNNTERTEKRNSLFPENVTVDSIRTSTEANFTKTGTNEIKNPAKPCEGKGGYSGKNTVNATIVEGEERRRIALSHFDILHKHIVILPSIQTQTSVTDVNKSNREDKNDHDRSFPFSYLCVDPNFLKGENLNTFIELGNMLISQLRGFPCQDFLAKAPPKEYQEILLKNYNEVNLDIWPEWMNYCNPSTDKTSNKKVPFFVLLLAKLELAVWGSYFRSQNKKSVEETLLLEQWSNVTIKEFNWSFVTKQIEANECLAILLTASKLSEFGGKIDKEIRRHWLESLLGKLVHTSAQCKEKRSLIYNFDEGSSMLGRGIALPLPLLSGTIHQRELFTNNKAFNIVSYRNRLEEMIRQLEKLQDSKDKFYDDDDLFALALQLENSGSDNFENGKSSKSKRKNKKKKKKNKNGNGQAEHKMTSDNKTSESSNKPFHSINVTTPNNAIVPLVSANNNINGKKDMLSMRSSDTTFPGDINLRMQGSSTVVVEQQQKSILHNHHNNSDDNSDEWSKVESKSRSNRVKIFQRRLPAESSSLLCVDNQCKGAKMGKLNLPRKRAIHRKIATDVVESLLKVVDLHVEESEKLKIKNKIDEELISMNKAAVLSAIQNSSASSSSSSSSSKSSNVEQNRQKLQSRISEEVKELSSMDNKQPMDDSTCIIKTPNFQPSKLVNALGRRYNTKALSADQNTAPTLPETLSANTAMSQKSVESMMGLEENNNYGSSEDLLLVDKPTSSRTTPPPLPTLLSGVGHSNSATSSVASSLEAPHTSGEQSKNGREDEVGYHLLSVCDRLTNDMATFMGRRHRALDLRRRERLALLAGMQEITSKLWLGRCHVEMYGSCATQLDLPSSDLDLVICGLTHANPKSMRKKKQSHSDAMTSNSYNAHLSLNGGRVLKLADELERQPWAVQVKAIPTASVPVIKFLADPSRLGGFTPHSSNTGYSMGHLRPNEYYNNSPMSSLPTDWEMRSRNMQQRKDNSNNVHAMNRHECVPQKPPQQTMIGTDVPNAKTTALKPAQRNIPGAIIKPYPPFWRGADVMNGLIKVDISFEGPEHGGIGSTAYAARVVQDACNECGYPPEATPTVQVTMVLKELLAQRRLNEPFSGGLSSYALLLMVVAIIRERRAIQAEMAHTEKQRRAVASLSNIVAESSHTIENKKNTKNIDSPIRKEYALTTTSRSQQHQIQQNKEKNISTANRTTTRNNNQQKDSTQPNKTMVTSSWASIAKQSHMKRNPANNNNNNKAITNSRPNTTIQAKQQQQQQPVKTTTLVSSEISSPRDKPKAKITNNDVIRCDTNNKNESSSSTDNTTVGDSLRRKTSSLTINAQPRLTSYNSSQGSNDVLEVLCSGEPTPGKLLMHFLLFYGHYFDAQSMVIDVSFPGNDKGPFAPRVTGGSIDPVTGMFTVDPLVVHDPLEEASRKNVARRCYAWSNVRSVFGQCYTTLQHTMERSGRGAMGPVVDYNTDPSSLLELLLSY